MVDVIEDSVGSLCAKYTLEAFFIDNEGMVEDFGTVLLDTVWMSCGSK
jgi:hypothetical protein